MRLFHLFAAILIATPAIAGAAALRVTPVSLDLTAGGAAGAVSLTNEANSPVTLQIRIYRWSQIDGVEQLEPTDSVIASPPAATIKPRETYTIRVMRIDRTPPEHEESYRLMIDEIPAAIDTRLAPQGVRMVLRTSLPVFFAPQGAARVIGWTARVRADMVELTATNTGTRHARLANLTLSGGGQAVAFGDGLNGYVLAGQTLRLTARLNGRSLPADATVTTDTDTGRLVAAIAVLR